MKVVVKDASPNASRASPERDRLARYEVAVRTSEADLVSEGFGDARPPALRTSPIAASSTRGQPTPYSDLRTTGRVNSKQL